MLQLVRIAPRGFSDGTATVASTHRGGVGEDAELGWQPWDELEERDDAARVPHQIPDEPSPGPRGEVVFGGGVGSDINQGDRVLAVDSAVYVCMHVYIYICTCVCIYI